ncbi:MAG: CaiB/BaiF CoA-transferase family protein [Gammaproteobacteria bacterium]|nr:MAG: CaiB/BaiF CoA-transferase family protein [Gammaproteobacteria bacterium]
MDDDAVTPLQDFRVLTLALNVPGPIAAARLVGLGASVIKIEPPTGDPLAQACPAWYQALSRHQEIIQLDLKSSDDRTQLEQLLKRCDLLLTASRPGALARLGLDWPTLHPRYPRLSQVAIVGSPGEQAELPGHDLTYQARLGLLNPPALPRTLVADLAGAEQAVSAALALLLAREREGTGGYRQVALAEAAAAFAEPLNYGLTTPGEMLGGGLPGYNLYQTRQGWIALAALEPHFWQRLQQVLELKQPEQTGLTQKDLAQCFLARTAVDWERWGKDHDLPIVALRESSNEQ